MMFSDFKERFSDVASAFGTKPDEGRAQVYFKSFRHLDDKQFQSLCEWAVQSCDRFPTIKDLYRGMYELNLVPRPKLSDLDKDVLSVVCTCGSSFVFSRINPPSTYHCPGEGCRTSYDSEYVIQNADQYGVLWADVETRMALKSRTTKENAMKAIYAFLEGVHADLAVVQKKTLKEIRTIQPRPEEMFAPKFDGRDERPNPFD